MINLFGPIPPSEFNYFEIGNFQIRYYALCILVGIIAAIIFASYRFKARKAETGIALDVAIWAVPMGIIVARIYHVLTHFSDYFGEGKDPIKALYIWEGGIAIYGGLIGGLLGAWIAARQDGVRFAAVADVFAPALILAQAIGRWGNYFNNELFGVPTDLPWGLQVQSYNPAYPVGLPEGVLFHPTFLYESIWDLLGVFVIIWLERRFKLQWGRVFAVYLAYYSFGRIFIESIRIDPSQIYFGIRVNVWTAILGFVIGLVLYFWLKKRHPGAELSVYLPNRGPEADAERERLRKEAKKSASKAGSKSVDSTVSEAETVYEIEDDEVNSKNDKTKRKTAAK